MRTTSQRRSDVGDGTRESPSSEQAGRGIRSLICRAMRAIPASLDPEIVAAIDAHLDDVARTHDVRIPWAIESGSRAWGCPVARQLVEVKAMTREMGNGMPPRILAEFVTSEVERAALFDDDAGGQRESVARARGLADGWFRAELPRQCGQPLHE